MLASKTELHEYISAHTSPESQLLQEVNRQTHLKVLQPHMISGHVQGRFLSMLSRMIKPKRILNWYIYRLFGTLLSRGACR